MKMEMKQKQLLKKYSFYFNILKGSTFKVEPFFVLGILVMLLNGVTSCSENKSPNANPQVHKKKIQTKHLSLEEFERTIKNGDVILKMGHGPVSKIAAKSLKENIPISHCGVVCKNDSSFHIIHSLSNMYGKKDGVQEISVQDFHNDTRKDGMFILRYKNQNKVNKISQVAIKFKDENILFDYEFNLQDPSKMYCSEFVAETMKYSLGKVYFGTKMVDGKELYTFNELLFSEDFTIVNLKH